MNIIGNTSFTHDIDILTWRWESSGTFTVKSLYYFLNFRGFQIPRPLTWWSLPVPPKIRVFLWLVAKNQILTKVNLATKGWTGSTTCNFFSDEESTTHLFLKCRFAKFVWFWMGQCKDQFHQWDSITDLMTYAFSLDQLNQTAFLIVAGAVIWSIWKHRNDVCFNRKQIHTTKTMILLILSLLHYGSGKLKEEVNTAIGAWIPADLSVLPLRVGDPADSEMMIWEGHQQQE